MLRVFLDVLRFRFCLLFSILNGNILSMVGLDNRANIWGLVDCDRLIPIVS